jgi:glutathione S-transferase
MSTKSLKLYGHAMGPNPWKVVIILEELSIPYEQEFMDMADLKKPPFLEVSVNGRVPAIEDPNTGITLWESNAIIDYLLDTYDKEGKLHSTQSPKKYYEKQWEHFQASGQGPYFGQKAWFTHVCSCARSFRWWYSNVVRVEKADMCDLVSLREEHHLRDRALRQ